MRLIMSGEESRGLNCMENFYPSLTCYSNANFTTAVIGTRQKTNELSEVNWEQTNSEYVSSFKQYIVTNLVDRVHLDLW